MTLPPRLPNTAKVDAPPPVLLAYQRRWIADDSKVKVCEKSRRIGLTWAEAADDVLVAASDKAAGGQNHFYIGYNRDLGIEYIDACAMWARAYNRAATDIETGIWEEKDPDGKDITTYTIRFPQSGHRIVALSSRPATLRGKQGTAIIDEAAFCDKLEELIKAANAFLIWGGRVRILSTHNGDRNAFNQLINDIRGGKRKGSVHRVSFAEAVADGLYKRVCMRLGKEYSKEGEAEWAEEVRAFYRPHDGEELDVIPSAGGGRYLPGPLIEARMHDAPVVRLERPDEFTFWPEEKRQADITAWCEETLAPLLAALNPNLRHGFGEDFGRSHDLTVLAPWALQQNLTREFPFLVELRNIPFQQQQQIVFYIVDRLPRFTHGALDARGNGQSLAEACAQRYGSMRITQVMLSESWYRENFPHFKTAFEDACLLVPRDADVLDDLRSIELINGTPKVGERVTSLRGKPPRHGDSAVALVLAYFASRQAPAEIGFTAVPKRSRDWERGGDDDMDDYRYRGSGCI